ncbi:DUF938 domain-containing protein [Alteromonas sp. 345S023]|uniref:DUF938 domain-containing protein n=1 Tax=Alteromonas profundi TaxID=2696062 RepID=A0A7X5RLD2_9ALTE|nr:DUF938 domain-containing protein [Alteromonas profundi]NDV91817.1 DUF938 domain-containing protein [Alteromonas profundi]
MMEKPFSQACENNKHPILRVLSRAFSQTQRVLEIGSGTGQHGVFFAQGLPHLNWHCSDQVGYHGGINRWIADAGLNNILPPTCFKVGEDEFPGITENLTFDGVFSANTAHIMQKHEVVQLMSLIDKHLPKEGVFCQYGPFTRDGEFSSQSNVNFHHDLLRRGCGGYRDVNELTQWAPSLTLVTVHSMPANNLLLEWRKN